MLTVVVAAHDEAAALPLLHPRIRAALEGLQGLRTRVLYVDDGSGDARRQRRHGVVAGAPSCSLVRP